MCLNVLKKNETRALEEEVSVISWAGSQVLTPTDMKSLICWDIEPYVLAKVNKSFWETRRLCLESRRENQARDKDEAVSKAFISQKIELFRVVT